MNYEISKDINSYLVENESTSKNLVTGKIRQPGKLDFKVTLPFNETSLKLDILLYKTSKPNLSDEISRESLASEEFQIHMIDLKILQPEIKQMANLSASVNNQNDSISISSTIPQTINQPFNEKPEYYWEEIGSGSSSSNSLIQAQFSNNDKFLLFPQDKINENYGKAFRLIEKFKNYNQTLTASNSTISLAKTIPLTEFSKSLNHLSKGEKKETTKSQNISINVENEKNIVGVQGQTIALIVNINNVSNKGNIVFKLTNSNGISKEYESMVDKGNNKLIFTNNLSFNKTQETYSLETIFQNQQYKNEITAKILVPHVKELKTPKLLLSSNKIKVISVEIPTIDNAPFDDQPTYYWQNKNDTKSTLKAIKEGNNYVLPEKEVGFAMNKSWQLVAKYSNVKEPIILSNSVLVSHKFNSQKPWWIIPTVFGIVGAIALAIGLIWYAKSRKRKEQS